MPWEQLDIGQAAVVCGGLVLAVEAAEGTDEMLSRIAGLPESLRGSKSARRGVLIKAVKSGQERRVDLPVIGAATWNWHRRQDYPGSRFSRARFWCSTAPVSPNLPIAIDYSCTELMRNAND